MKQQENDDDKYTPDEDAIEEIYMASDYGIVAIAVAVIGSILVVIFLSQVL